MPVTATGPISLPLENARILLSNCSAFRTWTGDTTVAIARERIHLVEFDPPENDREYSPEELKALRPYAVIDEFCFQDGRAGGDAYRSNRIAQGTFVDGGRLLVRFVDNINTEDAKNPAEARLLFMNAVGAVIQEVKANGGGDGVDEGGNPLLSIHSITRWDPYRRSTEDEAETQGDFYCCSFVVEWGV